MCNLIAQGSQYHFRLAFFKMITSSPNFNSALQFEQKFFPNFRNLDICGPPITVKITGNLKPQNQELVCL